MMYKILKSFLEILVLWSASVQYYIFTRTNVYDGISKLEQRVVLKEENLK